jgi:hypothetical protein
MCSESRQLTRCMCAPFSGHAGAHLWNVLGDGEVNGALEAKDSLVAQVGGDSHEEAPDERGPEQRWRVYAILRSGVVCAARQHRSVRDALPDEPAHHARERVLEEFDADACKARSCRVMPHTRHAALKERTGHLGQRALQPCTQRRCSHPLAARQECWPA